MSSPTVLSYGMGTNSAGLACLLVEKGERPDLILAADTGGERPETIQHALMMSDWLESKGFPRITFVKYRTKEGTELTLEEDCRIRESLPSIAFGWKSCSDRWKRRPQDNYMKAWPPAIEAWACGAKVTKLIGFDAGEPRRAKPFSDDKYTVRYPLIEWDQDRDDCMAAIERAGLPQPGKSSCFFCPSMKKPEVVELRAKHPELYERAIQMEIRAMPNVSCKGLGRWWAWVDLPAYAEDEPAQLELPCGCFDA